MFDFTIFKMSPTEHSRTWKKYRHSLPWIQSCLCYNRTVMQSPLNSVLLLTETFKYIIENHVNFRPIFRTWNGSVPNIHLLRPEDVEVRNSVVTKEYWFWNVIPCTSVDRYQRFVPWRWRQCLCLSDCWQNQVCIWKVFSMNLSQNMGLIFLSLGRHLCSIGDRPRPLPSTSTKS